MTSTLWHFGAQTRKCTPWAWTSAPSSRRHKESEGKGASFVLMSENPNLTFRIEIRDQLCWNVEDHNPVIPGEQRETRNPGGKQLETRARDRPTSFLSVSSSVSF